MITDPSPELIHAVRDAVAAHARRTPLLFSDRLSGAAGRSVHLKCENLQRTGSFKLRGALAALSLLEEPGGVVTASAGNHGVALSLAARLHRRPCTVVVPAGAPAVKVEGIRGLGAEVVRSPHPGYDDTLAWTLEHRERFGGNFVSAYDDPGVIAGNGGTTMLEILEEGIAFDTVVVPCGGGGLAAGMGIAARAKAPGTRVVAVNTDASPGMWRSRREGRAILRLDGAPTVCDGLEGGVGERAFRIVEEVVDEVVCVPEATVRREVAEIARAERMIVEGAAAVGTAALTEGVVSGERICVVLTGSNIDPELFRELYG